jgi:hypothetical protein
MRIATVAFCALMTGALLSSSACKSKEEAPPTSQEVQPTSVELKLFTAGELHPGEKIAALDVTVGLGSSVSLASANSSTAETDAVTVSGVSIGSISASNYSAPTATVGGKVRIVLVTIQAFGTGEFATIKGDIIGENTPPVSDFNVTSFAASTSDGQVITGLTSSLTVDIR